MALTLLDADRMIAACDEAGVQLFVVKQNRFNVPVSQAARGARGGTLRQAGDGHRASPLVPTQVVLRPGRLARHLGDRRWRPDEPGQPPRRPARVDDGRRRHRVRDVHDRARRHRDRGHGGRDPAVPQRCARRHRGDHGDAAAGTSRARSRSSARRARSRSPGSRSTRCGTWQFSRSPPEDDDVLSKYSVNPPNVYGFGHQAYYEHVVECHSPRARPAGRRPRGPAQPRADHRDLRVDRDRPAGRSCASARPCQPGAGDAGG